VIIDHGVSFASLTTLGVGGPALRVLTVDDEDDVLAAIAEADAAGRPLLILGSGSNLVVSDAGFPGDVVRIATRGIEVVDASDCAGVTVSVAAGEPWDELVQRAVAEGWVGIEALSGIPGLAGATPIQNVGAYGQEVAGTIAQVRTYDRQEQRIVTFAADDCGFGYRCSRFKHRDRWVVLSTSFQLRTGTLGAPVGYAELARTLGIEVGERAPLADVRAAVLNLRRGKGMVLDPSDPDTRSAGSFFTNPILDPTAAQRLPDDAPVWPQPDGTVKTSAAWLIERAGFAKGWRSGSAGLSRKHTLAITTVPPAHAGDVVALAQTITAGVRERFGIELMAEPTLVGFDDTILSGGGA